MNGPDPQLSRSLSRFLAGTAEGHDDLAEDALFELLSELPRPLPRPGFAERAALAAVMSALPAARAAGIARRWRRAALAACLAATACGVALLPLAVGAVRLALQRITFAGATSVAVRLTAFVVAELGGAVTDLFSFGQRLVPLQQALAVAVASPGMAAVVGLCLLISALALRFLHDLVERERSWPHAHPSR